jgi:homoserine dehydrogenase
MLGLGTVGSGVYRVLQSNASLIARKTGARIEVVKILVRDTGKSRGLDIPEGVLTDNPDEVLRDETIDIVVEVMGGIGLAREYALTALQSGKSLVTANKDMMAVYGEELFKAADENRCDLLFEASVAGGIPIIKVLKQSLAANRIEQVMGIVNGTTNYMLTKMTQDGSEFQDVLDEAQAKGYAEADPTNDVEGFDAARKIAILASIAFNTRIALKQVYVEGITRITAEDIKYACELGYVVKLLGIAKDTPSGVEVRVHPVLLPESHPLAAVNDVFNAVFVKGDAVGETMFYGRGAGELPTASAVTADVIDAARNIVHQVQGIIGCTCFDEKTVKPMGEVRTRNYLRLRVVDEPGVLAQIAYLFGENQVSLATVLQKETVEGKAELVLVTHEVAEQNLMQALEGFRKLAVVEEVCNVIRVEES